MATYLQRLAKTEGVAVAALLALAFVLGSLQFLYGVLTPEHALTPSSLAFAVFATTILWGVIPVTCFGAPAYALLWQTGTVSWMSTLVVGMLPGLAFLLLDKWLAVFALGCGAFVALATHAVCRRSASKLLETDAGEARAG